jgi:hypothetical protein
MSNTSRRPSNLRAYLWALLATATIAAALPALSPRAGAPIPKPIPSNCTIANPVLCTSAAFCPPVSYTPFRPTNSTLAPALAGPFVYGYYLQPDSFQVVSQSPSALFQTCLETCYGYGNTGDCKSVYQAYGYPTPPMYGEPGGDPSVACLLFNRFLHISDFEVVLAGERGNLTAPRSGDIQCPHS